MGRCGIIEHRPLISQRQVKGEEVFQTQVRRAAEHGASCYFASVGIANSEGKTEEEMSVPVKGVAYNVAFDGLVKMALPEAA